jgi:hypothetical protein
MFSDLHVHSYNTSTDFAQDLAESELVRLAMTA